MDYKGCIALFPDSWQRNIVLPNKLPINSCIFPSLHFPGSWSALEARTGSGLFLTAGADRGSPPLLMRGILLKRPCFLFFILENGGSGR